MATTQIDHAEGIGCLLRQTSELTAELLRLPAVATPDWGDRAASRLTRLEGAHTSCVLIWRGGVDGEEKATLEAGGVSVHARHEDRETTALRVRSRLEREFRLGALKAPRVGRERPRVERLRPASDNGDGRGCLWQGLEVGEVVSAALALVMAEPARVIECLVAVTPDRTEHGQRIAHTLHAVTPILGRRAALALADGDEGQSPWLTEREQVVLEHLVEGLSVRNIADKIGRSPHTVHDHVKNLHRKLGATTRGGLVARALGYTSRGASIWSNGGESVGRIVEPKGSGGGAPGAGAGLGPV